MLALWLATGVLANPPETEPPVEERRETLGGNKGADAVIDAMLERRDRFALRFVNFLVSSEFLEKES